MFSTNAINKQQIVARLKSNFITKVDGLVWDLQSGGKLGLQTQNGIVTLDIVDEPETEGSPAGKSYTTSLNPLDFFSAKIPAFACKTPLDKIEEGDIVVSPTERKILGWVVGKTKAALKLISAEGHLKSYSPQKVALMGTTGALVVKNLFNVAGGEAGFGSMQSMLMPMLMAGEGSKLEELLPILLMSQMSQGQAGEGATAAPAINPMMFLLAGNGGGGMAETMMMMQAMGGSGAGAGAGGIDPNMMMLLALKDRGGNGGNGGGGLGGNLMETMMLTQMMGGAGAGGAMNPMMMLALSGGLGGSSEQLPAPTAPQYGGNTLVPPLRRSN